MTPDRLPFYDQTVRLLEDTLQQSALAELFSGQLLDAYGEPLEELLLPDFGPDGLTLSAVEISRLFMAPDFSEVTFRHVDERDDGTPAGVHVMSRNDFVDVDEPIDIVAYQDEQGNGVRIDALYLSRILLKAEAPERFCTVAFGLQACMAYRLGFAEVTLFAAGRGFGDVPLDVDDLVGYQVWPKFGFDAPLIPADLNQNVALANCRSVQDVVAVDPVWWGKKGRGMEMRFDLRPYSRSWRILVDYIQRKLAEEDDE